MRLRLWSRWGSLPVVIAGPVQLTRVFQKLLVNSIRYRREAPPHVHSAAELKEREWLFSVTDNGIGIEPQYAERCSGSSSACSRATNIPEAARAWPSAAKS